MIGAGLKATFTCVDPRALDAAFARARLRYGVPRGFSGGVDPCGENGEFYSFVTDGPMFTRPVAVAPGEVIERDGFGLADLSPG
jgi:diphthamide synthase (EF-2-diphthine--ammonia ligase)